MRVRFTSMGYDVEDDLQLVIDFDNNDERLLARQFLRYKKTSNNTLCLSGYEGDLERHIGGSIRVYFNKESKK